MLIWITNGPWSLNHKWQSPLKYMPKTSRYVPICYVDRFALLPNSQSTLHARQHANARKCGTYFCLDGVIYLYFVYVGTTTETIFILLVSIFLCLVSLNITRVFSLFRKVQKGFMGEKIKHIIF